MRAVRNCSVQIISTGKLYQSLVPREAVPIIGTEASSSAATTLQQRQQRCDRPPLPLVHRTLIPRLP
jgi:hypothetical protein